jgi:hypothetical protein
VKVELYCHGGDFFARLGSGAVLRWQRTAQGWDQSRSRLPEAARHVEFEGLPEELREEVLAALARAAAVRPAGWESPN